MPYINGKRVTPEQWQETNGSPLRRFHTGPNGENPGDAPDLDAETKAPKQKKKAGERRSSVSTAKVAAAIADATGQNLPDLTGLDVQTEDTNDS